MFHWPIPKHHARVSLPFLGEQECPATMPERTWHTQETIFLQVCFQADPLSRLFMFVFCVIYFKVFCIHVLPTLLVTWGNGSLPRLTGADCLTGSSTIPARACHSASCTTHAEAAKSGTATQMATQLGHDPYRSLRADVLYAPETRTHEYLVGWAHMRVSDVESVMPVAGPCFEHDEAPRSLRDSRAANVFCTPPSC
jgi:hypothetical protein